MTGPDRPAPTPAGPGPCAAGDLSRHFTDAVAYEIEGDGADPAMLWPEELAAVARAVANRRRQYAAGRHCARAAMVALGLEPAPVPVGDQRAPQWPEGLRGSISHTDGYAVAVVRAVHGGDDRLAVGIDAEQIGRVTEHLYPRLFTASERAWLAALDPAEAALAATSVFGAKEAFYKAQFPLTGAWVGFHDVQATPAAGGGHRLEPWTDLPALARVRWPGLARHARRGPIVVSCVEVEGAD